VTGRAIQVTGVRSTVKALTAFEPEVRKRLNRTIRAALNQTRDGARSRYPKGDWVVRVNNRNMLGAIAARAGGGGDPRKSWAALPGGARAAIFEFIADAPSGRPQVQGLIDSLNRRYGSPGRFLWDAWDATGEGVLDTIRDAILQAEAELQANLEAAGEAF